MKLEMPDQDSSFKSTEKIIFGGGKIINDAIIEAGSPIRKYNKTPNDF